MLENPWPIEIWETFLNLSPAQKQHYLTLTHSGNVQVSEKTKLEHYSKSLKEHIADDPKTKPVKIELRSVTSKIQALHSLDGASAEQLISTNVAEASIVVAIYYNNAFELEDADEERERMNGIFAQASRINHSCIPNCTYSWNKQSEKLYIHAIPDISPEEELTICYTTLLAVREARMQNLNEIYGFNCHCPACDLHTEFGKASQERRKILVKLDEEIIDGLDVGVVDASDEDKCHKMLELMAKEGITGWDLGLT